MHPLLPTPGCGCAPTSLIGPLAVVPVITQLRSAQLQLVGPLVTLSVTRWPRAQSEPPPRPGPACLHVGSLVIAREITAVWSPSLCPSYNLGLYKVQSSPCCASSCYSCAGEEEGALQPPVTRWGVLPTAGWDAAGRCVALGFVPTRQVGSCSFGIWLATIEAVPQGQLLCQGKWDLMGGGWQSSFMRMGESLAGGAWLGVTASPLFLERESEATGGWPQTSGIAGGEAVLCNPKSIAALQLFPQLCTGSKNNSSQQTRLAP